MTALAARVRAYIDAYGPAIPTSDTERHKPRPPWPAPPEPIIPLLRDVLEELER